MAIDDSGTSLLLVMMLTGNWDLLDIWNLKTQVLRICRFCVFRCKKKTPQLDYFFEFRELLIRQGWQYRGRLSRHLPAYRIQ
ncbi:MAG: hypothetical protein VR65_21880 [Desulfobulbaceae bacterium BRH_c16a]|nr:MAG: hypothetical protein VR65_21880 [Desulfobulbaceae bacterium BRH_c16a]